MLGSLHPGNFSDGHNMSHNEVILSVIVAAVVHSLNAYFIKCYYYYCCTLLYAYGNFAFVVWSYLTSNFGTTKYFVIYESQTILPTKFIGTFVIIYQIAHS
jgi:hypothetical protein